MAIITNDERMQKWLESLLNGFIVATERLLESQNDACDPFPQSIKDGLDGLSAALRWVPDELRSAHNSIKIDIAKPAYFFACSTCAEATILTNPAIHDRIETWGTATVYCPNCGKEHVLEGP